MKKQNWTTETELMSDELMCMQKEAEWFHHTDKNEWVEYKTSKQITKQRENERKGKAETVAFVQSRGEI